MTAEELTGFIIDWLEKQNNLYTQQWYRDPELYTVDGDLPVKELAMAILDFLDQAYR